MIVSLRCKGVEWILWMESLDLTHEDIPRCYRSFSLS